MNYQVLINAIKVGDIAPDGGVATVFAALGRTRKDTLTFNVTQPTKQKIFVEEQKSPILNVTTEEGTMNMQWKLTDWDADLLVSLWGGSVVNGQWQEPDVQPVIEKSLRIEPRTGKPFIFPRCEITAQIEYDTTGKLFQIIVTAEKLQPDKAGTPAFMWGDPAV
jgi:hypothetical protein